MVSAVGSDSDSAGARGTRDLVVAGLDWSTKVIRSTATPDKATTARQMTSVNTEITTVAVYGAGPVAGEPRTPRRRSRRLGFVLVAVVLVALAALGATMVKLPYFALGPGSAVEVDRLVSAGPFSSEPSAGRIYLLTVRLEQVNLVDALRGWVDPEIDVVEQRRILPNDLSAAELAEVNRSEMDSSKQRALGVAFEQLGYDAITGNGAEVVSVLSGSPAGMALGRGDLIVGLDGSPVTTHYDVLDALSLRPPGSTIELTVRRGEDASDQVISVVLDSAPGQRERAFLGATLTTMRPLINLPFPVEIGLDNVGGPSAGLAFALEVLDALSPGDLTGGQRVAATGTIELDASVGAVGGVAQKTAVARRNGVDLLLVPRLEFDEARQRAGEGIAVEAVDNLSDALRALADHGGDALSPAP